MRISNFSLGRVSQYAVVLLFMFYFGSLTIAFSQLKIRDESIINQQERMVFKSWDRNKFTPTSGFLGLNPYYWLTWGLHPNYPKTDLRPLSLSGAETLRLGLTSTMQLADRNMQLGADTLRNLALDEITAHSGLLSNSDPLWVLYYARQFKGMTDPATANPMQGLSPEVKAQLISEGSYDWYISQRSALSERLEASRRTNQDRGSRILSYQRFLLEYRKLLGFWSDKTSIAERLMKLRSVKSRTNQGTSPIKNPAQSDVDVARKVLAERKY